MALMAKKRDFESMHTPTLTRSKLRGKENMWAQKQCFGPIRNRINLNGTSEPFSKRIKLYLDKFNPPQLLAPPISISQNESLCLSSKVRNFKKRTLPFSDQSDKMARGKNTNNGKRGGRGGKNNNSGSKKQKTAPQNQKSTPRTNAPTVRGRNAADGDMAGSGGVQIGRPMRQDKNQPEF